MQEGEIEILRTASNQLRDATNHLKKCNTYWVEELRKKKPLEETQKLLEINNELQKKIVSMAVTNDELQEKIVSMGRELLKGNEKQSKG